MPPNQEIEQLKERVKKLEKILDTFVYSDKFVMDRDILMTDGRKIFFSILMTMLSTADGLYMGTTTSQRLGFYGALPVVRQGPITAPSGGGTQDTQARTAINDVISALETYGLLVPN